MDNAKVRKVSAAHRMIHTDIEIDAPAKDVWAVLADTKAYDQWAVFLIGIDGDISHNSKITATFQVNPKKQKLNTIEHTIRVSEGSEFFWAEKGPMGICDNHHFKVEGTGSNTCRFTQSDELTKGMTWLLGGTLSGMYAKGYQAFNRALKQEAERRFKASA